MADALEQVKNTVDSAYVEKVEEMRAFWRVENTEAKVKERFAEKYHKKIEYGLYYYAVCRIAGMNVDLDMLVHEGLPDCGSATPRFVRKTGIPLFIALDLSLDVIADACRSYGAKCAEAFG